MFELHVNMTSEVLAVLSMEIISDLGFRSGRWIQTLFLFWGSGLVDGCRHYFRFGVQVW